jgi:peptidoglycan/xylan/chitin deacetylase (PgdA/CDA1 family)
MAARLASLLATILLPGRARAGAWLLHEGLRIVPSVVRNNDWLGPLAKSFPTTKNEVWLTIADGPTPGQTPGILNALDNAGARASFFVIGRKVDWNRPLCRTIVDAGHTLENHTYSHPSALFWTLPACAMRAEIVRCNHAIHVASGRAPHWFRSPAGMTNACVHPAAARAWLKVAGWSASGLDGIPGGEPEKTVRCIMRNLTPGGIIVIHEGPGRRVIETLEILLAQLGQHGFRTVIPDRSQFP